MKKSLLMAMSVFLWSCQTFYPLRVQQPSDPLIVSTDGVSRTAYSAGGQIALGGKSPSLISINPRFSIARHWRHWTTEGFLSGYLGSADIKMDSTAFNYLDGKKSFYGLRLGGEGAWHWQPGRFVIGLGAGLEYYYEGGAYEDFRRQADTLPDVDSKGENSDIGITARLITEYVFAPGSRLGFQPYFTQLNITAGDAPLAQLGSHLYWVSGPSIYSITVGVSGGALGLGYRRMWGK